MSVDVSLLNALTDVSKDMFLGFRIQGLGLGLRVCSFGLVPMGAGLDEPESLILAQSERWRHA